jgi:hypothetical protein
VPLDVDKTHELFKETGFRPEVLVDGLGTLQDGREFTPQTIGDEFAKAVHAAIEESDLAMLKVARALTPLQASVLRVMIAQGEKYAPYAAATLDAYREEVTRSRADANVDVPNVQAALEALQNKGLVWRAAHGEYALEDQGLADLMERGLPRTGT